LRALDALLAGLVDYAGLFPPASESMGQALQGYASYLSGPDRDALGRLIVPLSRLSEFERESTGFLLRQNGALPWKLSVIAGSDASAAFDEMTAFNRRHADGSAVIDVIELKASSPAEIERQRAVLPGPFTSYFELPLDGDIPAMFKTLGRAGARAKIRTGGVTADAFPPADAVIDFMMASHREGVPFKATAGLHHPVRGVYRLTYEPESASGAMYGFLNVLLAASLIATNGRREDARALLEEAEPSAFSCYDDAIVWRGHRFDADQIRASRKEFAISFGSCSFREPVDEIENLARSTGVGAR
jgi:hypothetical protein